MMALPVLAPIAKVVGGTGLRSGARSVAGRLSTSVGRLSRGITGTTAGAGAGGLFAGYGIRSVEEVLDDAGLDTGFRTPIYLMLGLAVVYVFGQLFDIQVGG